MATPVTPGLAADTRGLAALRAQTSADPKAAIQQAAKQFEALFMRELLKSMRQASPASGLMENQATQLGTEMLDGQWADQAGGGPGSLSALIAKQLERQMGIGPSGAGAVGLTRPSAPSLHAMARTDAPTRIPERGAAAFVQQHAPTARAVEATSGIPATFMVAQAAHETAWGRKEILHADGSSAHNLFGIKAGAGWRGPVAEVMTTEYVEGRAQKVTQRFRAYANHAESFADYARLIKTSPRYQSVMAAGHDAQRFAHGLQQAGYATDPAYANKLERVIETTMRLQRTAATSGNPWRASEPSAIAQRRDV